MAALCASRWSAIGCIDGRTKNLSKKERLEANLCLPLVGSRLYEWHDQEKRLDTGRPSQRVVNAEIGSRRYRVTISGPGGHSWANFGRVNPAEALGRIVAQIATFDVPRTPRTTYNVGRIGGGTSVNSIPFEAWFEFDMRSVDENELIALEQKFLRSVKEGVDAENQARDTSNGALTVDAKRIGLRHAIPTPPNKTLTEAAGKAIRELGLGEPEFEPSSTDSNAASSVDKPAITMGGGGIGANFHSLQEWYEPKDAYRGVQAVLLTVLNYDSVAQSAK